MDYSIKLKTDLFPTPVIVIYGSDLEACSRIARNSYGLEIEFTSSALAMTELVNDFVVMSIVDSHYREDNSILVHETLHAAIEMLARIGGDISYNNQEVLAYLQQYLYKRCLEFISTIPHDKS